MKASQSILQSREAAREPLLSIPEFLMNERTSVRFLGQYSANHQCVSRPENKPRREIEGSGRIDRGCKGGSTRRLTPPIWGEINVAFVVSDELKLVQTSGGSVKGPQLCVQRCSGTEGDSGSRARRTDRRDDGLAKKEQQDNRRNRVGPYWRVYAYTAMPIGQRQGNNSSSVP